VPPIAQVTKCLRGLAYGNSDNWMYPFKSESNSKTDIRIRIRIFSRIRMFSPCHPYLIRIRISIFASYANTNSNNSDLQTSKSIPTRRGPSRKHDPGATGKLCRPCVRVDRPASRRGPSDTSGREPTPAPGHRPPGPLPRVISQKNIDQNLIFGAWMRERVVGRWMQSQETSEASFLSPTKP
jgi:hypothetical protein